MQGLYSNLKKADKDIFYLTWFQNVKKVFDTKGNEFARKFYNILRPSFNDINQSITHFSELLYPL
jgi:hypothetical protein